MSAAPNGPEALFLANLPLIDEAVRWVCRRHHCSAEEAEDFRSIAHLRLIEDGYAVLRRHEGRSSLRSYLAVVLARLFVDHRRHEWGVWRPCAAARRLGPLAVKLDTLVNRDGHSLDQAVERLRTNERTQASEAELRRMAAGFPARVKRRREDEALLEALPAPAPGADERVLASEHRAQTETAQHALQAVLLELEPADRLCLELRYQKGTSVAAIARMLGVDQKPLYRRLEVLRARLRQDLEARGVEASAVLESFQDVPVDRPGARANAPSASVHSGEESAAVPGRSPQGGA